MSEQAQASATPAPRRARKTQVGIVTSNKMQKTVVVEVLRLVRHAKYKKYVKRLLKFKAHDERQECQPGDKVLIVETRPISKEKRWKVQQIVERAA
jgi:small subunit ribosomal protein S17